MAIGQVLSVDTDRLDQFVSSETNQLRSLRLLVDSLQRSRSFAEQVGSVDGSQRLLDGLGEVADRVQTTNDFVAAVSGSFTAGTSVSAEVQLLMASPARRARLEAARDRLIDRPSDFDLVEVPEEDRLVVVEMVSNHLIDVADGKNVWSDDFRWAMSDLQHLNTEVAELGDPALSSLVGRLWVEAAIEIEAEVGQADDVDAGRQVLAAALANQGVAHLSPYNRRQLVAELSEQLVTADDAPQPKLRLLINALDLDADETVAPPWADEFKYPWLYRVDAAALLVESTQRVDGSLTAGGSELVDLVTAELVDDDFASTQSESLPPIDAIERWPGIEPGYQPRVAGVLLTSLTAPNYGLSTAEYEQVRRAQHLVNSSEFGMELAVELEGLLRDLAPIDDQFSMLLGLIDGGVPVADAVRIADSAVSSYRTDRRVEVLRHLLPTGPLGNAALPFNVDGSPDTDGFNQLGIDPDVGRAAGAELSVLQNVQIDRYHQRLENPVAVTPPLDTNQLALVDEFQHNWDSIYKVRSSKVVYIEGLAFYPSIYETVELIAAGETEASAELAELAAALTDSDNAAIWGALYAAGGDTWFGADGSFQADGAPVSSWNDIKPDDFDRLGVQLLLHQQFGPDAARLVNDDGVVTEDSVKHFLETNGDELPPVLADQLRAGMSFGLGEDTFGWDEVAEIAGLVGLAATTVVLAVPSLGLSTWVTAGLAGLALVESFGAYQSGNYVGAVLALGSAGLGGAAVLMLRSGLAIPVVISRASNGSYAVGMSMAVHGTLEDDPEVTLGAFDEPIGTDYYDPQALFEVLENGGASPMEIVLLRHYLDLPPYPEVPQEGDNDPALAAPDA